MEKNRLFAIRLNAHFSTGHPGPSDVVQRSIGQTNPPGGEAVHASGKSI